MSWQANCFDRLLLKKVGVSNAKLEMAVFHRGQTMRLMIASTLLFLCCGSVLAADAAIDLVRVFKAKRKLELVSEGKVIHKFSIVLGSNPVGHKSQEGDGKTPEGKYILDYKKSDSSYYRAFHVSYPNANDIASARIRGVSTGSLIMVHGQKNGLGWLSFISQQFDWTAGCIALRNSDMDIMWSLVAAGTRIEINP